MPIFESARKRSASMLSVPNPISIDTFTTGQIKQVRQHLLRVQHVGVFGVHVAQVDGVACLGAIETAVLHHGAAEIERESIENRGMYAVGCGGGGDEA
jgi:hypothetical protein